MMAIPPAFIGVPFRLGGRGLDGCDCWGLVRLAYAELLGIELPLLALSEDVMAASEGRAVVADEALRWQQLPYCAERPGDVLVFRTHGWPAHIGMAVGRRRMLHVSSGSTSRIECYETGVWTPRLDGIYRHPRRWQAGR